MVTASYQFRSMVWVYGNAINFSGCLHVIGYIREDMLNAGFLRNNNTTCFKEWPLHYVGIVRLRKRMHPLAND